MNSQVKITVSKRGNRYTVTAKIGRRVAQQINNVFEEGIEIVADAMEQQFLDEGFTVKVDLKVAA